MQRDTLFSPELISNVPRITLSGSRMIQVEQHKGLMAYQQDGVTLMTAIGQVRIKGEDLGFRSYTATEAIICGKIEAVLIGEEHR